MAKQLRAFKTDEELSAVPLNEPVLVELPGMVPAESDDDAGKKSGKSDDDSAKQLQDQLAAFKAQADQATQRAETAERAKQESDRVAREREEENKTLRAGREQDETALINNGLASAQAESAAAQQAYKLAMEGGDFDAAAKAQGKISRAEAKILNYEAGAAQLAERTETRKVEVPERQVVHAPDFAAQVHANPQLLSTERDWMILNQDKFKDPQFNRRLDAAYISATEKEGLKRGTPAYFDFIEKFTGIKVDADSNNEDDEMSVSAPVSRNDRGNDGRPTNSRITLSPEQREIAASLGISDIEYAKQVARFDQAKREDPEKYGNRS